MLAKFVNQILHAHVHVFKYYILNNKRFLFDSIEKILHLNDIRQAFCFEEHLKFTTQNIAYFVNSFDSHYLLLRYIERLEHIPEAAITYFLHQDITGYQASLIL